MTYTYPENSSEKIKGTFVDAKGKIITFETPGVFSEDGTCNTAGCDAAVYKMVEVFNSIDARKG
jgi:hypothetical protein